MPEVLMSNENELFLNDFKSLIQECENKSHIEKKASINFVDLSRIADFLTVAKPQSHTRVHKDELLNYLTLLESYCADKNSSKADYLRLKGQKLNPIVQFMRKYGFRTRFNLINLNIVFGIILDIVFFIFIYPNDFYFVPIFTVILFIKGMRKLKKLKRDNKLLNL